MRATQTTILYLNKKGCESVPFGLPPREEQDSILEYLMSMEQQEAAAITKVEQLHQIKAGLLQDLLTGAVRVAP